MKMPYFIRVTSSNCDGGMVAISADVCLNNLVSNVCVYLRKISTWQYCLQMPKTFMAIFLATDRPLAYHFRNMPRVAPMISILSFLSYDDFRWDRKSFS